jgi:hypothetical protein
LNDAVFELAVTVLVLVLTVAGGALVVFLHRKYSHEQLHLGASIAKTVVQAVEQVAARLGLNSAQKLARALDSARHMASKFGLTFTDDQWKALIEAAVQEMNKLKSSLLDGQPTA